MKKLYFIFIIFTSFSCKKNEIETTAKACFQFSSDSLLSIGDTLKFSNCSENATSYYWDFGDSTTSIEKLPNHFYNKDGKYTIKLRAINKYNADSVLKVVDVIDKNYTYLNYSISVKTNNPASIDIDIDKDNITDVTISAYSFHGSRHSEHNVFIKLNNNFEISATNGIKVNYYEEPSQNIAEYKYDTILIPKEYPVAV